MFLDNQKWYVQGGINMDPLAINYYALLEIIATEEEYMPETIFRKHGLIEISTKELRKIEALEMKRLYEEERLSYREIGKRFNLSGSGVFRRIKKWGGIEDERI